MRGPELLTYDLGQGACAFSTERRGGYSEGAYASFNANAYCGDDERMVRLNRDLLCEALGLETFDYTSSDTWRTCASYR